MGTRDSKGSEPVQWEKDMMNHNSIPRLRTVISHARYMYMYMHMKLFLNSNLPKSVLAEVCSMLTMYGIKGTAGILVVFP